LLYFREAKKENLRNFYRYVLSNIFLRGGKKIVKEGRLADIFILHIVPYVLVDLPPLLSRQSEVKI